jgi:hypothetical protein
VYGIFVSENCKGFLKFELLDETMSSKISARRAMLDEAVFHEEALGAGIVSGGEMDLGKPERIFRIIYPSQSLCSVNREDNVLVKASSLSPMYMAESYWCLLMASCLQSFSNFSMK